MDFTQPNALTNCEEEAVEECIARDTRIHRANDAHLIISCCVTRSCTLER